MIATAFKKHRACYLYRNFVLIPLIVENTLQIYHRFIRYISFWVACRAIHGETFQKLQSHIFSQIDPYTVLLLYFFIFLKKKVKS